MPFSRFSLLTLLPLVVWALGGLSPAATVIPIWAGDPGTTQQEYQFDTNSLSPMANALANPFGTPAGTVSITDFFASGWQDPSSASALSGVASDGAWDVGREGTFTVDVPFSPGAPPAGSYYRVDFHVHVVAYQLAGISAVPDLVDGGMTVHDPSFDQITIAPDPEFAAAKWEGLTWAGYFDGVTDPSPISFQIKAPASTLSVLDTVEVFTRYSLIPEPSVPLLVMAGVAILGVTRRCR
jgi:hypothetical protein